MYQDTLMQVLLRLTNDPFGLKRVDKERRNIEEKF